MEPGRRLGVYELVEELGAGGMGVVWRAHDRRLNRDVALKILPPHLAARPEALMRFEREARGLAALSHPNIISIFDLGEEAGLRYLVTELLSGETLRRRLARGPLPWREATELCATIADGLAAAHARGILHRDLKPENIFLTGDGRVKILDFGLAKEVAVSTPNATTVTPDTEPVHFLGTLGYTPPEQLRGEEMDFASDLFSVGCVLFELLSGRPAFLRGSSAETIAAIMTEEPSLPHAASGATTGVPAEVSRIVKRCIEKRAAARFQSASDLAFALRQLSSTVPTEPLRTVLAPRRVAVVAAIVVIGAAIAAYAVLHRTSSSSSADASPAAAAPQRPIVSVAVLPFTADAEHVYAGEGLAESLVRRLAPLQSVRAVSRKTPAQESHVLRGSIRGSGANMTVVAELVERGSERPIWSRTYNAGAGDLLGVESRLSADVERFLTEREGVAAPSRAATTVDAEAYREYLKGRHYWNKFTVPGFEQALEHFQRSIDHDPTYALAYAGLADTYTMLAFHGVRRLESMPKARTAAARATELDPQLGEAWTSLGTVLMLYDWKWAAAERALRRGVELSPRYPTAHHAWAIYLSIVGRGDEALRHIQTASELDPLSLVIYIDHAWIHYTRNDTKRAVEVGEQAIRHDPRSPLARETMVWYLDHVGRHAEAAEMYASALELAGKDPTPAHRLRDAHRRGGPAAYLRQRLALAEAEGDHVTMAGILVLLDEHDRALDALEQAVQERERDVIYVKSSPTYAPLRGQARFEKVVREVGLP